MSASCVRVEARPPQARTASTGREACGVAAGRPVHGPQGYSVVPEIDMRVSAGPGAWNDESEEPADMWL